MGSEIVGRAVTCVLSRERGQMGEELSDQLGSAIQGKIIQLKGSYSVGHQTFCTFLRAVNVRELLPMMLNMVGRVDKLL